MPGGRRGSTDAGSRAAARGRISLAPPHHRRAGERWNAIPGYQEHIRLSKPVVLIAEGVPRSYRGLGPDFGCVTVTAPTGMSCCRHRRRRRSPDRSATKVDAEAPRGRQQPQVVVARGRVRLDNVDVPAATQRGVMVVNAPTSNIVSAAELAVACCSPALATSVRPPGAARKEVEAVQYSGVELADKTVGLWDLAGSGCWSRRAPAPSASTSSPDPFVRPTRAAQLGVRMESLDELLAERLHHRAPAEDQRRPRSHRRRSAAQGQADGAHRERRTGQHRGQDSLGLRRWSTVGSRAQGWTSTSGSRAQTHRCSASTTSLPHRTSGRPTTPEKAGIAVAVRAAGARQ